MTKNKRVYKPASWLCVLVIALSMLGSDATLDGMQRVENTLNWYTWVMGQTLSLNFHFLDLLELLSR